MANTYTILCFNHNVFVFVKKIVRNLKTFCIFASASEAHVVKW